MAKLNLDVADFKKEMKRVEEEVSKQANMEIHDRINYATETLKIVTPVDTGKAREGWKKELYPPKRITASFPTGNVAGKIYNNVEYIDRLNNGHSKQAPKYFIEQVLIKIGILTPN
jgi:hypothetical protein